MSANALRQYQNLLRRLEILKEHGAAARRVVEKLREEQEQLWYELTPTEREEATKPPRIG